MKRRRLTVKDHTIEATRNEEEKPVLLVALEVAATVSDVADAVDEDDGVLVVAVVAVVAVGVVSCCSSFVILVDQYDTT